MTLRLGLLICLAGCNVLSPVNEDNFLERYTESICDFEEHCSKSAFLEVFDDVEE